MREENFGFKLLGAFIGSTKYIQQNLLKKTELLHIKKHNLINYPYIKNRYLLIKFCFISKFNYIFKTQYPQHTNPLIDTFENMQRELTESLFQKDFNNQEAHYVNEITKFSCQLGGLGLRCQKLTQYSAFISSITLSNFDLSKSFPQHIQTGGPEKSINFYGFADIDKKLDENPDNLLVEPNDQLTEAIFSTASKIAESSEE
jgi:hypothetical protein